MRRLIAIASSGASPLQAVVTGTGDHVFETRVRDVAGNASAATQPAPAGGVGVEGGATRSDSVRRALSANKNPREV